MKYMYIIVLIIPQVDYIFTGIFEVALIKEGLYFVMWHCKVTVRALGQNGYRCVDFVCCDSSSIPNMVSEIWKAQKDGRQDTRSSSTAGTRKCTAV